MCISQDWDSIEEYQVWVVKHSDISSKRNYLINATKTSSPMFSQYRASCHITLPAVVVAAVVAAVVFVVAAVESASVVLASLASQLLCLHRQSRPEDRTWRSVSPDTKDTINTATDLSVEKCFT